MGWGFRLSVRRAFVGWNQVVSLLSALPETSGGPERPSELPMPNQGPSGVRWLRICLVTCVLLAVGCRKAEDRLEPRFLTWAELRAVHDQVLVTPPGENERHTYPRERLA